MFRQIRKPNSKLKELPSKSRCNSHSVLSPKRPRGISVHFDDPKLPTDGKYRFGTDSEVVDGFLVSLDLTKWQPKTLSPSLPWNVLLVNTQEIQEIPEIQELRLTVDESVAPSWMFEGFESIRFQKLWKTAKVWQPDTWPTLSVFAVFSPIKIFSGMKSRQTKGAKKNRRGKGHLPWSDAGHITVNHLKAQCSNAAWSFRHRVAKALEFYDEFTENVGRIMLRTFPELDVYKFWYHKTWWKALWMKVFPLCWKLKMHLLQADSSGSFPLEKSGVSSCCFCQPKKMSLSVERVWDSPTTWGVERNWLVTQRGWDFPRWNSLAFCRAQKLNRFVRDFTAARILPNFFMGDQVIHFWSLGQEILASEFVKPGCHGIKSSKSNNFWNCWLYQEKEKTIWKDRHAYNMSQHDGCEFWKNSCSLHKNRSQVV